MSNLRGLPPIDSSMKEDDRPALDKARYCPTCRREARIVSNTYGIEAYCGPCKKNWPISSTSNVLMTAPNLPRGLSKQTLVEPDWNRAQEDTHGDPLNEQIGPKRR